MSRPWIAAVLLALTPGLVGAQMVPRVPAKPARHSLTIAGIYAQPLGEFGQNVKRGFGLDGSGRYGIDARGILGLQAHIGYIQYNSRTQPFIANTGFGPVELESETKSGVLMGGVGPQLRMPDGPVRPYVGATIGFVNFSTSTAINLPARSSQSGTNETLDSQTISSDFVRSVSASGGIAFALPFFGSTGALADLGVRYHRNGRAQYVSSQGVQYNGSVTPTVTATESEADFLLYRIGVVIPIG